MAKALNNAKMRQAVMALAGKLMSDESLPERTPFFDLLEQMIAQHMALPAEQQEAIQKQEELERKLKEKGEDYIKQMQELFIKDLQENNKQFVLQQVKKYWIENPMIKWLFMDFVSKYL